MCPSRSITSASTPAVPATRDGPNAAPMVSARCAHATSRARARAAATAASSGVAESVQQPPTGGVRGHRPEQGGLVGQDRDVADRLGAVGDRHRQIDQHPPRIMPRPRPTHPVQRGTQLGGQRGGAGQIGHSRDRACDTTPDPSGVTMILGRVAVARTPKVPLYQVRLGLRQPSLPWSRGSFGPPGADTPTGP